MKRINNPYAKLDGFNCFGCSPNNHLGLKMEFFEEDEFVISHWQPNHNLQGYLNILHGGIQTALMDEIGSWIVQLKIKTAGVTSSLNTKFINPVPTNKGQIKLKASIVKQRRNLVDVHVELFKEEDVLCAQSDITYFTYPLELAKKKLYFPEQEEFYDKETN